jgi:hypothetical protein
VVGETIWVLRADGKLFEVSNMNAAKPSVKEYSTQLTTKQDPEGLCYDKKNNRLLIAIKGAEPAQKIIKASMHLTWIQKKWISNLCLK